MRAFLWAVGAILGLIASLHPLPVLPFILGFIALTYSYERIAWFLIPLFALFGVCKLHPPERVTHFHPKRLDMGFKFGRPYYVYKGSANGGIPLSFISNRKFDVSRSWEVDGTLEKTPYGWSLKLNGPVHPIEKSFSFAKRRFDLRSRAQCLFKRWAPKEVADTAAAFFLGARPPPSIQNAFRKAGMSHLLCLSGFHFAAMSALLSLMWRSKKKPRLKALFLITTLSTYALCVGDSPSVLRAYIAALLYFSAPLFYRESDALRSLGIAALLELTYNPWSWMSAGFQLSYGATASLLLFYEPIKKRLEMNTPAHHLGLFDLHAYIINALFLRALALQLAVSITVVPLCLTHFHLYPLGSLIFNFIYPPLITIALFLIPLSGAPADTLLTSLNYLPRYLTLEFYLNLHPTVAAFWLFGALTLKCTPAKMTSYLNGDRSSVG